MLSGDIVFLDNVESESAYELSQLIFDFLPLFRKRLSHFDFIPENLQLPSNHAHVMAIISRHGKMTMSTLAQKTEIAKPNISIIVNKLLEEGYISRMRDLCDKRVNYISITDKGEELISNVHKAFYDHLIDWSKKHPSANLEEIYNCILRLSEVFVDN